MSRFIDLLNLPPKSKNMWALAALAASGLPAPVLAANMPDLSPAIIAADVTQSYDSLTGGIIYSAPDFDPFEAMTEFAGSARLRTGGPHTALDGQRLPGGTYLDISIAYLTGSSDIYDVRGFERAVFLDQNWAAVTKYDSQVLECSRQITETVYDTGFYNGAAYGYMFGLYRPFPYYRGHGYYRPHRPNGGYWGGGYGGGGYWGGGNYFPGNGHHYRPGDHQRPPRHGDRNRDEGSAHSDRGNNGFDADPRHPGGDSGSDNGSAGGQISDDLSVGFNGLAPGLASAEFRRRHPRNPDQDRDENNIDDDDRPTRPLPIMSPNTQPLRADSWRRRLNIRRLMQSGQAAQIRRAPPASPAPAAALSSGTLSSGTIKSRAISSGSLNSGTIKSRAINSGAINSGGMLSAPSTPPAAMAASPRVNASQPARAAPPKAPSRARPATRPIKARPPKAATPRPSRPASRPASRAPRSVDRTFKSSNPRNNSSRNKLKFFPAAGLTQIGSFASERCVKQENISLFIPADRLRAARFDGLTVLLMDNQGREIPAYIPPNYIEGLRSAVPVSAYAPYSSAPGHIISPTPQTNAQMDGQIETQPSMDGGYPQP